MPEQIRDYLIEGLLGRGGMGSVYLARHKHLNTKAALKVLLKQFSDNSSIKARFINEAKLLHNLQHKNIVQQREFFEENGRLVLVMEYVDGNPLDKMIGEEVGPIPWEKALPLFTQILDGIGYAHSKGIVHRDIKPANILISKEGTVKVTDLGIAKIAGEQGMTRTGAQMGTLYYESPEQIKGAKDVDHRSDIYSLGMTLYEMLAGRLPFEKGGDTSEFEIMNSVVHRQNNLDPREFYPHIPEWLVKTIQKATELNPSKRFQSCEHFKQVIEKYGKLSESENTFWSEKVASVKSTPITTSKPVSLGSTSPPSNDEKRCPKCGSSILPDKKFCDSCGEKLFKKCPECKADIRWSKNFCPDCGIDYKQKIADIEVSKREGHTRKGNSDFEEISNQDSFSELLMKLRAIISGADMSENTCIKPNIPVSKLNNAMIKYAKGAAKEDVLLLHDGTLFDSAKDGFILTSKILYWHNLWDSSKQIRLPDIKSLIPQTIDYAVNLMVNDSEVIETNNSIVLINLIEMVRNPSVELTNRFQHNGVIILDLLTPYQWLIGPDRDITWHEAKAWVDALGDGWRMPSVGELQSLNYAGIMHDNWGPFQNSGECVWSGTLEKISDPSTVMFVMFSGDFEYSGSIGLRAFAVRSR